MNTVRPEKNPVYWFYGSASIAFGIKNNAFSYLLLIYSTQVLGVPGYLAAIALDAWKTNAVVVTTIEKAKQLMDRFIGHSRVSRVGLSPDPARGTLFPPPETPSYGFAVWFR